MSALPFTHAPLLTPASAHYCKQYQDNGFISAVPIISQQEAAMHRRRLEQGEALHGSMHYKYKVHTLFRSPYELATHPALLDVAEALLGPDLLLYNVTYIIKESNTLTHVSWHQDLTYWGFDSDQVVTAWLALSPATEESGCMRMLPGSHRQGQYQHSKHDDADNVLEFGQTVMAEPIDEAQAVMATLEPGEASFHHGHTFHASMPNDSDERRIGLNIQYISPKVRQTQHNLDSALLVRGVDHYHHFAEDVPAIDDFSVEGTARQQALADKIRHIYQAA